MEIDLKKLVQFKINACQKTYASGKNQVKSCRKDSHDYSYAEGDFRYYDSFVGSKKFAGQECIYYKDNVVFAMNYYGFALSTEYDSAFLKEALRAINEKDFYRGPQLYTQSPFTYQCLSHGEIQNFQGEENILYYDKKVYTCYFQGGLIE